MIDDRQAEHVRDCLLAGRGGRADLLAERLGETGILLNAVLRALEAVPEDQMRRSVKRLVSLASATLREITRHLDAWGR